MTPLLLNPHTDEEKLCNLRISFLQQLECFPYEWSTHLLTMESNDELEKLNEIAVQVAPNLVPIISALLKQYDYDGPLH